jgi:hypothetical protein
MYSQKYQKSRVDNVGVQKGGQTSVTCRLYNQGVLLETVHDHLTLKEESQC